jgi:hypothetical protein
MEDLRRYSSGYVSYNKTFSASQVDRRTLIDLQSLFIHTMYDMLDSHDILYVKTNNHISPNDIYKYQCQTVVPSYLALHSKVKSSAEYMFRGLIYDFDKEKQAILFRSFCPDVFVYDSIDYMNSGFGQTPVTILIKPEFKIVDKDSSDIAPKFYKNEKYNQTSSQC